MMPFMHAKKREIRECGMSISYYNERNIDETVINGTILGAYTGLSIGWLRYAGDNQMQDVWNSVGYGAIVGTGVGFAASVLERKSNHSRVLSQIDEGGVWGNFWIYDWFNSIFKW